MAKLPLIVGAAASALILTGYAYSASASAMPRPLANGAAGLFILVEDEENAEVQNLLEPESDEGTPMGAEKASPEGGAAAPKGAMEGESAEKALEETVGDDGVNQIQEESIPE
jgi:hypothetical protein